MTTLISGLILGIINIVVYSYFKIEVTVATVLISIILIMLVHIKTHQYICAKCNHKFKINFLKIFSFHAGEFRKLKCPICGEVTWSKKVSKY